jgi:hypothetical protein
MPVMFNRAGTKLNGVFSSDKARLTFVPNVPGLSGVLVQGMNFNYSQAVTRLYEVGQENDHTNIYYVGGRTQGAAQIARVIGPNQTIALFYSEYGDVCQACKKDINLSLSEQDCCGGQAAGAIAGGAGVAGNALTFVLQYVVLVQIGVSINAQDMLINESGQLMFSGLEYN